MSEQSGIYWNQLSNNFLENGLIDNNTRLLGMCTYEYNTEKPCRVIGFRSYDVIMISFLYFVPLGRDVYVCPLLLYTVQGMWAWLQCSLQPPDAHPDHP